MSQAGEYESFALPHRTSRLEQRGDLIWLSAPFLAMAVLFPFAILIWASREHLVSTLLAYVNCWILGGATYYLASRKTIEATLPLIGLIGFWLGWPLGNLYFALFSPDLEMTNLIDRNPIPLLQDNMRQQLVCMVFLLVYLPMVCLAARRKGPTPRPYLALEGRYGTAAVIGSMTCMAPFLLVRIFNLELPYVLAGIFKYGQGLMFVAGVLYPTMTRKTRITFLSFIGGGLLLTTVTSDRSLVAYPAMTALLGALLLSSLSSKKKLTTALAVAVGLPFFVLIGSTTRMVLGTKERVDLGTQWQIVKNWREYQQGNSALDSLFARGHWTGGHSILAETPEVIPYMDFKPVDYSEEAVLALVPQKFYFRPHYQGNRVLLDYGHLIYEGSSVEVSAVGHAWMLGGYPTVILCAVLMSVMHVTMMAVMRRLWRSSHLRALTILGILSSLLIGWAGWDPIIHFRGLVWYSAFGWFFYLVLRICSQADVRLAEMPVEPEAAMMDGDGAFQDLVIQ